MAVENKGGRPRKVEEEKRTDRVICRVTKSEKLAVKKRALKEGLSESELLRDLLFSPPSYSSSSPSIFALLRESKNLQDHIRNHENEHSSMVNIKLVKILKSINDLIENA